MNVKSRMLVQTFGINEDYQYFLLDYHNRSNDLAKFTCFNLR